LQPAEQFAVVDANLVAWHVQRAHHRMIDRNALGIREQAVRAHDVNVALPELAEAATSRTFSAPHRPHLVAPERAWQVVLVLRDNTRQRDGKFIPQRHIALALILEAVEQLLGFRAGFAEQDLSVLNGRRVERIKPEALKYIRNPPQQPRAGNHHFGQVVPEALQNAWFDARHTTVLTEGGF
jgi:hypothetical protein